MVFLIVVVCQEAWDFISIPTDKRMGQKRCRFEKLAARWYIVVIVGVCVRRLLPLIKIPTETRMGQKR